MAIQGSCDPKFEKIRDAFALNFERGLEPGGAAVSVTVHGRPVVDLHGGFVDRGHTQPWQKDTLINLASTTKGILAICVLHLVDRGVIEFDAPVARYWPEFARAGKEGITVRDVLSHRAGLPAVRPRLSPEALYDWTAMTAALAAEEPWWPPGTQHGYHAMTIGWLAGELVRRVTGRTVGQYLREELASPLGLDLHIGLGPREEARTADVRTTRPEPGRTAFVQTVMNEPDSMSGWAFLNPVLCLTPQVLNSHAWRAAELPFANAHGTASSLAHLFGALAHHARGHEKVLSASIVDAARTEHAFGYDPVLREATRYGIGFMLPHEGFACSPNPRAFGNPGAGGFLAFADPEASLGFAYVTSKMSVHTLLDPRAARLSEATYACL
ncbi:beta-lactamase family protein [Pendulispora brunnea]|uniref:Beta-lactamase family protein n=1 Tax=Pendulispora brunnea TaxID=2905690 RepID=A0ABZ2K9Y2_9BACT